MKPVAETLDISRSNVSDRKSRKTSKKGANRKTDDVDLLPTIRSLVDERPSYGYRRIHRRLVRSLVRDGKTPVNHKRVYRIMKQNHLLLPRHSGTRPHWTHDGIVRTTRSNRRWCSDVFEIPCSNGEIVRVAFALDCYDREVLSYVATTGGVSGGLIRDLMVQAMESRFGRSESLPHPIEWLSDNGSCYTAKETREFAQVVGLVVCTTPVKSPESNGMAEAFVKTVKRDYVQFSDLPDANAVFLELPKWFEDYNENHPHKGLKMLPPREFRRTYSGDSPCPVS